MSRASRRSASDRPDWVAPTRGSRASVSAAHATRATKRITRRIASIYRIGPEAERAQDGADAGPLIDRTDVVVGVERQADVVRAGGRGEPLLLGAPLEAPPRAPVPDPDCARARRGGLRPRRRSGRGSIRRARAGELAPYPTLAIASISTRTALGSAAACTVERAGLCVAKCLAYTSFMAGKSAMSTRYTIVFTTRSRLEPAPCNTAARFRSVCSVCSAVFLPTMSPVLGSSGIWPAVYTIPSTTTAWL